MLQAIRVKLFSKLRGNWTVMVMSQAHQPVLRFRFPKFLFYLGLIIVFSLSLTSATAYFYSKSLHYENTSLISNLDQRGEELTSLKKKATEVEDTVKELEQMEAKMREITDLLKPEGTNRKLQSTSRSAVNVPTANSNNTVSSLNKTVSYEEIQDQLPALMDRYNHTFDKFAELEKELKYIPSIWPTSATRLTSNFGKREDPFSKNTANHKGTDIAGPWGSPIYASADGKVVSAGYDGGYGNAVLIRHSSKFSTRYGHMAKLQVSMGDIVKKGQIIGTMGSTGRSTGVHLHYEVLKYGTPINPYPYMILNSDSGGR